MDEKIETEGNEQNKKMQDELIDFIENLSERLPHSGIDRFIPKMKSDITNSFSGNLLFSLDRYLNDIITREEQSAVNLNDIYVLMDIVEECIKENGNLRNTVAEKVKNSLRLELQLSDKFEKIEKVRADIGKMFKERMKAVGDFEAMYGIATNFILMSKGEYPERTKEFKKLLKESRRIRKEYSLEKKFEKLNRQIMGISKELSTSLPMSKRCSFIKQAALERIKHLNTVDFEELKKKKELEAAIKKIAQFEFAEEKKKEWNTLKQKAMKHILGSGRDGGRLAQGIFPDIRQLLTQAG